MDKKEAKKRAEKLRETINYHRYLYHVLDKQEISDSALDSLKKELFDIESKYPDLITPDSPTQRIGGKPLKEFKKVSHSSLMTSFNDAFTEEDMIEWEKRIKKLLSPKEQAELNYFCEVKFDGLAIELIYKDKIFSVGATRGDGIVGEDVTQNLKTIEEIPLKLRDELDILAELKKTGLGEIAEKIKRNGLKEVIVRGEVILPRKEFERINAERKKNNLPEYANPRNVAAGSIRQLDPNITASRKLQSFIYDLLTDFGQKTHQEKHIILRALGFKTHKKGEKLCSNLEEVFAFRNFWQREREKLPFEIDGIVVQVNDNHIYKKLGVVGKAPRGGIAFKFPLKQSETILEDIVFQVGRTGAVTPVAVLKPVSIGGTIVSRATLHNMDEIKRLGVKIGDTVIVGRAGDVIPAVVGVLKSLRTGNEKEIKIPKLCPYCQTKLVKKEGEVILRCPNENCPSRKLNYFYNFVSKKGFSIDGLGKKIIDQLVENGLLNSPADIFFLKEGDLVPLERFADRSAKKLVDSINKSKTIKLSKFIYALGINGVGEETASLLAEKFGSLESIISASVDQLISIKDIGEETANSIFLFFQNEKNLSLIKKLLASGVKIINPQKKPRQIFSGKIFVITGTIDGISRSKLKDIIRENGGTVSESVSKNTDFVLVGKSPGSKLSKANKLGVKIISPADFFKMIK